MSTTNAWAGRAEKVPVPVALVARGDAAHRVVACLAAEGCCVETFDDVQALWSRIERGATYVAVWFNPLAVDAEALRRDLEERWGAARPVLVRVGEAEAPLWPADAAAPWPLTPAVVRSLVNLLACIAGRSADLEALHDLDERLRNAVEHDLRNPLTAVTQLGGALSNRERLSPTGRVELDGLLRAARGAIQRLEALGQACETPSVPRPTPAPVAIRPLLAQALSSTGFAPSVVQWVPDAGDPVVTMDGELFRRVLEHLLANTRNGGGTGGRVTVVAEADRLSVEVIGGGPLTDSTARRTLEWCALVVEAHGGSLTVHDGGAEGPLVRTEWPQLVEVRPVEQAEAAVPARAPLLVWFADDEVLVRKAMGRLLRRLGYDVVLFESGDALLTEIEDPHQQHDPDVVISDANMPGTQGLDVLRRVRAAAPRAARVLFTAYQPNRLVVEAFNRGTVHRYITKGQGAKEIESCLAEIDAERAIDESSGDGMRADLERLLRDARVTLHLQPLYDAQTRELVACEALLRSLDPAFKGPLEIVDATRTYGREAPLQRLLSGIGREIRAKLPPHVDLFMNVDPIILHNPDQLDFAFDPLYPVARSIVLELTERARLGSDGKWRESVDRLRRLGFRIALDDVGAGYNSLGAVAAVNPEVIKLDISLVSSVHRDETKAEIVHLLCEYARRHDLATVAEGIEEAAEAERCRELGVRWLQGYHLARPMPLDDLIARHPEAFAARETLHAAGA